MTKENHEIAKKRIDGARKLCCKYNYHSLVLAAISWF
jgi:hypothetical protein